MVTAILQGRKSTDTTFNYHEEKVARGKAFLVDAHGFPGNYVTRLLPMAVIQDTFHHLEDNPAVSRRMRTSSFHFAVNPAPEDNMYESLVIEYVKELIAGLGLAGQPYVVYRHEDIERVHWHVLTTRIREDGSMIPDSFSIRKVHALQESLAEKYGFAVGKVQMIDGEDIRATDNERTIRSVGTEDVPMKFDRNASNLVKQAEDIFRKALGYDYKSLYQFQCVLRSMNITARVQKKGTYSTFVLSGQDDEFRRTTGTAGGGNLLGWETRKTAYDEYMRNLEKNARTVSVADAAKIRMIATSEYIAQLSGSSREYAERMKTAGLFPVFQRGKGSRSITRVVLVDTSTESLVDSLSDAAFFPAQHILLAESEGRWTAPGRGREKGAELLRFRTPLDPGAKAGLDLHVKHAVESFVQNAAERDRQEQSPEGIRIR